MPHCVEKGGKHIEQPAMMGSLKLELAEFVGQPNEISYLTLYTDLLSQSETVLHCFTFLF